MSTQKFWVAWQTVVSFVIPALTIIACWAILIYLFLTRQFQSILKSVTLKAMFVTGFFLLCASPFCISFFVVISISILMMMTILVMMIVLVFFFLHILLCGDFNYHFDDDGNIGDDDSVGDLFSAYPSLW